MEEDSALISRESVEKEGEEAGLAAKLTKPTFCKVSPPAPLLRVIPCRAPARPSSPASVVCDSGSLSRGWGAAEEPEPSGTPLHHVPGWGL